MRRDATTIVKEIMNCLESSSGEALSPSRISQKTGIHYKSVKRYIRLIEEIQKRPNIIKIEYNSEPLYTTEGLLSLPLEKQRTYVREKYLPEPEEKDMLLIKLLKENAVSIKSAQKIEKTPVVKDGIKYKHFKETKDGRIYLTRLGISLAKGSLKLFPELK